MLVFLSFLNPFQSQPKISIRLLINKITLINNHQLFMEKGRVQRERKAGPANLNKIPAGLIFPGKQELELNLPSGNTSAILGDVFCIHS